MRPSPQLERDGQRIYVHPDPPGGLVAVAVQFAVVQATDRDRVFVADLSANRTRLGEANVVRFGRRAAANDAGLGGDELAVFLVAQAKSLRCHTTGPCASGKDDRMGVRIVGWGEERLPERSIVSLLRARP
jgi:hypothetical protein